MSHTPLVVFQARLLENQEGPNTERYVFGKLSTRCSNAALFGTGTVLTVEIPSIENRRRGVMYNVEYGNPCI